MKRYCKECRCYHPETDWLYSNGHCRIADMWWESVQNVDTEEDWLWEDYEAVMEWKANLARPLPLVENVRVCGCKTHDYFNRHDVCQECLRRDREANYWAA